MDFYKDKILIVMQMQADLTIVASLAAILGRRKGGVGLREFVLEHVGIPSLGQKLR